MLTVACVFVRGPYPYTPEYVERLARMTRRYIARPFRFVCLTDQPETLPGLETIRIASLAGVVPANGVGYWNKLRLFDPTLELTGRVLYIDLDSLVVNDLAPIIDFPAPFAIAADELVVQRSHLDRDGYGRRIVRRFNSSVMVFEGGAHAELFTEWTPWVAEDLSTDQDWIGAMASDAVGLPWGWFPRISQTQPPWRPEHRVVLVKKPKCHVWAEREPWFEAAWGGWAA